MTRELTDKQYLLLNAYYDGELKGWQQWRVQKLIDSSSLAYEYVDSLESLTQKIQAEKSKLLDSVAPVVSADKKVSSWEALASRITQEERNELYLGTRQVKPVKANPLALLLNDLFPNNFSKAFATACLAFVLGIGYQYSTKDQANLQVASQQQEVSLPVLAQPEQSLPVRNVANQQMRLDWMKSDGRIQLIPADETSEQKIIWVMTPRKIIVNK